MPNWARHLDRVLRWDLRVHDCAARAADDAGDASTDELEDFLYAAFVSTYHLKDHLKGDARSKERVKASGIEAFISSSDPLAFCADLANAYKHLELTRRIRRDPHATITQSINVQMDTKRMQPLAVSVELYVASGRHEATSLLRNCVLDWEYFLVEKAQVLKRDWRDLREVDHLPPPRRPEDISPKT